MSTIEFWRTCGIIFAATGQTLFVALYLTFPWWEEFLGRALFFKALTFALLVDVAVIGRMYDWPHEDAMFVSLYWVLGIGIWVQLSAFAKVKFNSQQTNPVSRNRVNLRD